MKIAAIDTFLLQTDLAPAEVFGWSLRWAERRSALYVKITSDEGVSGWAEAGVGGNPVMRTAIEHHFKPLLLGRDPFDVEVLWEEMYALTQDAGQKGEVLDAISAIDVALWDLLGRTLGKPVHKLLGGAHRTRVMAYASAQYYSRLPDHLEHRVEEAKRNVHRGFRALKMKVGGLPMLRGPDARRGGAAGGPRRDHLAHRRQPRLHGARRHPHGTGAERFDIGWFEEPVVPEDLDGYVEVKRALDVPVAGGECEYTLRLPRPLREARGGHRPARHLPRGRLLRDEKDPCPGQRAPDPGGAPRLRRGSLGGGQPAALRDHPHDPARAQPEVLVQEPILEYPQAPHPLLGKTVRLPALDAGGYLPIPDGPGLGVEIDEEAVRHFAKDA